MCVRRGEGEAAEARVLCLGCGCGTGGNCGPDVSVGRDCRARPPLCPPACTPTRLSAPLARRWRRRRQLRAGTAALLHLQHCQPRDVWRVERGSGWHATLLPRRSSASADPVLSPFGPACPNLQLKGFNALGIVVFVYTNKCAKLAACLLYSPPLSTHPRYPHPHTQHHP